MIKWIGQHIWDFVSRFRNDVYLESLTTTDSDPDKFLALDADNKIVYRTGSDIRSDIDASTPEAASTTSEGIVELATTAETTTGTDTSRVVTPDGLKDGFQGSTNIDTLGTITTGDWRGTAINGTYISTLNQDTTGSAATLTTTRAFQTDLASTSSANFDGSAANTHGVTGTLAVANGGTGLTSISTLLNSNVTSVSGNAGGLTASTSNSIGVGSVELGHADDTTIARSASGTVTIEGKEIMTKDKKIHIQQTSFNDDLTTTEHFIPFNTTTEHANITNIAIPMVMPVDGKLLKIHMRVNNHHNTTSNTVTFKLYDVDDGEIWNAGNSNVLGTKVIDGTAKEDLMVADFTDLTTSGSSGTNAFSAGDLIGVTIKNSVDLATTNYLVTMVFELDFSSY